MITLLILLLTVAISLNYFRLSAQGTMRTATILMLLSIAYLWESNINDRIDLFNGAIDLNKYTIGTGLILFLVAISVLSLAPAAEPSLVGRSIPSREPRVRLDSAERILFIVFALLGGLVLSCSTDFLAIILGLELQSYSVYILAASYRNYEPSEAAGLKYFLLGALSSALIFMGFAILYVVTGTANLNQLTAYVSLQSTDSLLIAGLLLVLSGCCWKIAIAPVHAWSIDVYDAVPTRTTAVLSLVPKIALFFLIFKIVSLIQFSSSANSLIFILVCTSLITGAVAGLLQPRIKRLLAYSSVLNVGFILMIVLIEVQTQLEFDAFTLTLYIAQYVLVTAATWICLVNFAQKNLEVTTVNNLAGVQSGVNVSTGIALVILILSTAGIPPMVGWVAKYHAILSAVQSNYISLALVAIVASVISTVYYLSIVRTMYASGANVDLSLTGSMQSVVNRTGTTYASIITLCALLYGLQHGQIYSLFS